MKAEKNELISISEASIWASTYLNKEVTTSNISYLIQYAKIRKVGFHRSAHVFKSELKAYYDSVTNKKEISWKNKLGLDLNWTLSFDNLKESDTTKHVHRLHPYKGKFIPQLVEYFLDDHVDEFKRESCFKAGDIILDPFCGSGTALVQANELGINAIGVDISEFNSLISNCKISKVNIDKLQNKVDSITNKLELFADESRIQEFESELSQELNQFNNEHFHPYHYKILVQSNEVDEIVYGKRKEIDFVPIYKYLIEKYQIEFSNNRINNFLEKWFMPRILDEARLVLSHIDNCDNSSIKDILMLILSRTMRSCRATTHSDLATLIEPVHTTYYCSKHYKICKPLFTILKWWKTYSKDTIKRLQIFNNIKTNTRQICLTGDSREIDILNILYEKDYKSYQLLKRQKIAGIFSSPPYVGLIDYHEQHAYSYDLFNLNRRDELEIGAQSQGKGKVAQKLYIESISQVLTNAKRYMIEDYNIFLVANDKNNLYPTIAEYSRMKIVNQYKRPVLNRTEKDKNAYSEVIFHMREK